MLPLCYINAMHDKNDMLLNAKQMPQVYYCRHMYAGLAGYSNETILVDLAALKALAPTFAGKPLYVEHQDVVLAEVENADGYVTDCWYDPSDGWLWAKFVVKSDAGHQAIANGWSVSNAYTPETGGAAGTHTNIPYDRKISGGEFNHLAIVPNPRYESAMIYDEAAYADYQLTVLNSKKEIVANNKKEKTMLKGLFTNQKTPVADVEDLNQVMVEMRNGTEVSIAALQNSHSKLEKLNAMLANGDYIVETENGEMTLSELIEEHTNMCKAKNAKNTDEDKENGEDEDGEKENADAADADKENAEADEDKENMGGEEDGKENGESAEEEKANAKAFNELKNAASNKDVKNSGYVGRAQRLETGKKRF